MFGFGIGVCLARLRTSVICLGFVTSGLIGAQTLVPGHPQGSYFVTPSGTAVYQIPIQLPPGVAGLVPNVSLSYSSQGSGNIAGQGWSLGRASVINRCPRARATDGVSGALSFNTDDRFCLDGQRLILVSGTYGAAGSEYRTEVDQFSRVIASVAGGNAGRSQAPSATLVY